MRLKDTKRRKGKWGPPYTLKQKGTALAAVLSLITVAVAPGLVGASGANTVSDEDEGIATVSADVPRSVTFDLDELAPTGKVHHTYPTWNQTAGHLIYYGNYEGNPQPYRVLSTKNTTGAIYSTTGTHDTEQAIFLDGNDLLYQKALSSSNTTTWASSNAYTDLNSTTLLNYFALPEQTAITSTKVHAISTQYAIVYGEITSSIDETIRYIDTAGTSKVFLLSCKELDQFYEATSDRIKYRIDTGNWHAYWMRARRCTSTSTTVTSNAAMAGSGYFGTSYATSAQSISPAFNVALSSIEYTSLSTQSKTSEGMTATSTEVGVKGDTDEARATRTWDLTLKGGTAMTAEITDEKQQYNPGAAINLEVGSLGTPETGVEYTQLTGMLIDSNDRVVYTGRVGSAIPNQMLTVQVPSSAPVGNYTFKVFAEDVNGATYTDYASEPVEFDIQVGYQVEIVNEAVTTKLGRVTSTGAESQFTGTMTPVSYTVGSGYYIDETYEAVETINKKYNGLTIDIENNGKLTISGSPTMDTTITLTTAKEKEDRTDCPDLVGNLVESVQGIYTTMEYAYTVNGPWTQVSTEQESTEIMEAGTYYFRYSETATHKASAVTEPIIVYGKYTVKIVNDAAYTNIDGESVTQEVTSSQGMQSVTYNAKEGYSFATTYEYAVETYTSGVKVAVTNSKQITISGTPIKDVTITLVPIAEEGKKEAPIVSGGILKIVNTDASMEYAASETAPDSEWVSCTLFETEATQGTWYVRYAETTKFAASIATKVVVTGPLTVEVVIPDDGKMYWVEGSGDMIQEGIEGTMIAASFRADADRYFPEDYAKGVIITPDNSGISVTWDNSGQITVAGTPKENTQVRLTTSLSLDSQSAPEVQGGTGVITGTDTLMVYATSEDATTWYPCTDDVTNVIGGTYYVKYAARTGYAESPTTQVQVENTPRTITIVNGDDTAVLLYSGSPQQTVSGHMQDVVYRTKAGYIFPEDYSVSVGNGVTMTRDSENQITFSGAPVIDMEITIVAADLYKEVTGYTVTVDGTKATTIYRDTNSGDYLQTPDFGDAIEEIIYEADTNYYFPESYFYANTGTNGITISRVEGSENKISIKGTPTADVNITLGDASVIPLTEAYSVWVKTELPPRFTRVDGTGTVYQTGIIKGSDMTEIIYTADTGYYFPLSYANDYAVDGVVVTRVDESTIKVSGTPTANVELTLPAASIILTGYNVSIINPSESGITKVTGDDYQSGVLGAMGEVVYQADYGYEFPSNYSVSDKSGVTVEYLDESFIRVSGTPTNDVTITLVEANKMNSEDIPPVDEDATSVTIYKSVNSNMTRVEGTGYDIQYNVQNNEEEMMVAVEYTADENYHFPEGYTVSTSEGSGITVAKVNDTTIRVSGKPSGAITVMLTAATWCGEGEEPDTTGVTVDIINTASTNLKKLSGDDSQSGVIGTMEEVIYEANDGYYLPENYYVTPVNGVRVYRLNDKQLMVVGTPTENTIVILGVASQEEATDTPEEIYYEVEVTNPSDSGIELCSGNPYQYVKAAMTDVVYVAKEGYYFDMDYAVDSQAGVEVRRINEKTIIVTGTPTQNVYITLEEATEGDWGTTTPDPDEEKVTYTVEVIPSDEMVLVSGQEEQEVEENTLMGEVSYTLIDGYYFPEGVATVSTDSGVGVRYVNSKTIVVHGAPTEDVVIDLRVDVDVEEEEVSNPDVTDPDADKDKYTVTVNGADNLELVSGLSPQTVVDGYAMTDVVYTVAEGYYFPTTYTVNGENGITVRYINSMMIVVSGAPDGDAVIDLIEPDVIPEPEPEPDVDPEVKPEDPEVGVSVVIINPDNSGFTRVTGTGSATQMGLEGAMEEVLYSASEEYYFPVEYSVASVNGVEVTRMSENTIRVYGTPSDTTVIELLPATRRDDSENPYPEVDDDNDDDDDNVEPEIEYPQGVEPDSPEVFPEPDAPTEEPTIPNELPEIEDLEEEDVDGDGTPDVNLDTDGDGIPDVNLDTDGDGVADINIDTDGDGIADINIDTDGDMLPDVNIDTTGDLKPNVNIDTDNTGVWTSSSKGGNADGVWKPDTKIDSAGSGKGTIAYFTDAIDVDGDGVDDRWVPDRLADHNGDDVADYDTTLGYGINIDTEGDGVADLNVDTDGDGEADVNIDTNGNREPDLNIDTDRDGEADLNIDTDGDGEPDLNIDTDGDGEADLNIDTDGDGEADLNIDTDGDGEADLNIDTDGDGEADLNIDTDGDGEADLNIDTDGDGEADLNIDTDGDGIPDLNVDTDGDGIPDENVDTDEDGEADTNITKPGNSNWAPSGSGVQTGDDTSVFVYILGGVISLLGVAVLLLKRRNRCR